MRRTLLALSVFFIALPAFAQDKGNGDRKDPLTTFLFGLRIEAGIGDLGAGTAFFKSVSGLSSETEVIDFQEGGVNGTVRKIPGRLKYTNIILKRGITADKSVATWRKLVEDGLFEQARKNGTITLVDKSNKEIARWAIINAWPAKISIEIEEATGEPQEVILIAVDASRRQ